MPNKHEDARARRVVAGLDASGRSTVLTDDFTATRVSLPAFTVNDVWRIDSLPAPYGADSTQADEVELDPPKEGLVVRLATFPPDSDIDPSVYAESIGELHGDDAKSDSDEIVGLHETSTIDVAVILDGDIYAVYESGEVLLHPGDTVVNRGIKHAWSNRGTQPVTMVAVMVPGSD